MFTFSDNPSLLLVDPMSIDLLNTMETRALISMLDFMDTEPDQQLGDKLLVSKIIVPCLKKVAERLPIREKQNELSDKKQAFSNIFIKTYTYTKPFGRINHFQIPLVFQFVLNRPILFTHGIIYFINMKY